MVFSCNKVVPTLAISIATLCSGYVQADAEYQPIIGKDGWLFHGAEIISPADTPKINGALDMVKRFNKVLAANGITMAAIFAPIKMRVYPEFLPPTVKQSSQMMEEYNRMLQVLRAGQVNAIDLSSPMMNAANKKKYMPFPLFLKLDRHWSPSGVLVAADAIKVGIDVNPTLKKVYDATPSQAYKLEISKDKKTQNSHDLVGQLSPQEQASHNFPPENSLLFKVVQVTASNNPQGGSPLIKTVQATSINRPSEVVVLGSSDSMEWTDFPKALRYTLQRDIAFSNVVGAIGPWYGAITYFSDETVQSNPPKLLLFEMTERELHMAPDTTYRVPRYRINPTEWLLRVSALIQQNCKSSLVTGKIASTGIAAKPSAQKADGVGVASTTEAEFIDIDFINPLTKLDYLNAQLTTSGSKVITLEASGPDTPQQKFIVEVKGDNIAHALKYPLLSLTGKGYTKVRIYPGTTSGFSLQGLKVCRQPEDLLS